MLCDFNILAGMDVSYAVDCGYIFFVSLMMAEQGRNMSLN